jgi:pimeloyl-ACP methyl ester carboxylesterase
MAASNVTSIMFPDTGHWLIEQRPAETKAALKKFLANRLSVVDIRHQ